MRPVSLQWHRRQQPQNLSSWMWFRVWSQWCNGSNQFLKEICLQCGFRVLSSFSLCINVSLLSPWLWKYLVYPTDKMKDAIIAKLANQAADFYGDAFKQCQYKDNLPKVSLEDRHKLRTKPASEEAYSQQLSVIRTFRIWTVGGVECVWCVWLCGLVCTFGPNCGTVCKPL